MVDVIPDMPPGTLAFRVSGRLTRDDYVDVLVPPLREAVEAGEMRLFRESEFEQAKTWLAE
jgi:hypothetical protein